MLGMVRFLATAGFGIETGQHSRKVLAGEQRLPIRTERQGTSLLWSGSGAAAVRIWARWLSSGQGAVTVETRADDETTRLFVDLLNHEPTVRAAAR